MRVVVVGHRQPGYLCTAPVTPGAGGRGRLRNDDAAGGEGLPLLQDPGTGDPLAEREDESRACFVASFCAIASLILVGVATGFLSAHVDQRLTLTTAEPFHDWGALMGVFRAASAYDPVYNPPHVDGARFVERPETVEGLDDMYYRGLLTEAERATALQAYDPNTKRILSGDTAASPSLLARLLSVSGCSHPDAMLGATPVTRTPGCQCIGAAYVGFVRATVNMTSNVTVAAREDWAREVLRCLDRRVTWRTWALSQDWRIHPLGLALYADSIFFLTCMAFLLSYNHWRMFPVEWSPGTQGLVIKGLLTALTVALGLVFVIHDWQSNLFQPVGLVLCLSNLVFAAHKPLDYPARRHAVLVNQAASLFQGPPDGHPLMVCFWLNVPLIISALFGVQAVTGLVRDYYAFCGVFFAAAAMGFILQRMFWVLWHVKEAASLWVFPPLILGFFDILVGTGLILFIYRWSDGLYSMGHWAVLFFVVLLYPLLLLGLLVVLDIQGCRKYTPEAWNQAFSVSGGHIPAFLVTLGVLFVLTVMTIMDAQLR